MIGDATLFSRTDLVEPAWRIAQPILDAWAATPPRDFPNYPAGSWGPKAAFDLMEREGRPGWRSSTATSCDRVPLLQGGDPVCLHNLAMMLEPGGLRGRRDIIKQGEMGEEMYFICRGQVEVLDATGTGAATLADGEFFGEMSLLLAQPRTASIRATTACDLFVLHKADFDRASRTTRSSPSRCESGPGAPARRRGRDTVSGSCDEWY